VPQFLIVYNQRTGNVSVDEYSDAERDAAVARRFELERAFRLEPHMEVVLLVARTRNDLERTHARYFRDFRELIASGG
jgi:hypothetical protein